MNNRPWATDQVANSEFDVTATPPESPIRIAGTHHITLIGSNETDTVAFYRDLLGMPLVLRQPNLDDPETTHLFFDTGDGRILTFFVRNDRESKPTSSQADVGSVHHLAFSVAPERYTDVYEALHEIGHPFNEFDRGIARSLYTRDHNGLTLELTADRYDIPADQLGEALAAAHRLRKQAGATYVKEQHMETALDELGLEINRHEFTNLPDAPTGTGV